ncbi:non ribosomal peptide synthase [Ectocarpus siliculosus]|uniref:NADP-dependent 3-hydroxy acid dehydrogenase YdfG n=1 Tax=Ectocarpus siliculosus TaxID=2880 RepID=D8LBE2_ECTSI|nr:non ribosomal peptide synthase [Ectocarpus siliculosus]|eukprot:CBN76651.1 non ribosomal peptide synthase [Ectocarpus siliculosus]
MPLSGKVVVVTGSSGGIGAAIASTLASAGANVVLGARRIEELEKVKTKIEAEVGGDRVMVCKVDVTKRDEVKALVAAAEAGFGPVDVMVNNAGVMYFTNMKNLHEDEWERTVDVNCKGTMFGIGAVLGGMIERGSGHIVNISSDAGRRIFPSLAVYCASKYFVEAMSEGLRREVVGTGLKVTTIQPGDCATDLVMNNTDKEAADEQGVAIGVKVGTGSTETQVLQPEDVAAAVLYAVTAPSHVAVNEVLVEPRDQT